MWRIEEVYVGESLFKTDALNRAPLKPLSRRGSSSSPLFSLLLFFSLLLNLPHNDYAAFTPPLMSL